MTTLSRAQDDAAVPPTSIRGIGIAIEDVATFPEAEDYQDHEFYRDRFTPAELARCSADDAPRSSFCTLAALKRAVAKAGAVVETPERLADIEIAFDEFGMPSRPDCLLSLDRTETTAVAVCLWLQPRIAAAALVPQGRTLASYPPMQRLAIRAFMGIVALSLLFIFGAGVWFVLSQIFH